jgi:hypothetical protein
MSIVLGIDIGSGARIAVSDKAALFARKCDDGRAEACLIAS